MTHPLKISPRPPGGRGLIFRGCVKSNSKKNVDLWNAMCGEMRARLFSAMWYPVSVQSWVRSDLVTITSSRPLQVLARYFNIEVEVYTTDMTGMEPMIMNEGGEFKARILYTGGHWKGLRDAHGDFWQVNTRKEDDAKACWQVRRMVFEALAPAENAAGEPAPACAGHDETVSSGKLEERPVQDCSLLAGVEPAKGVAVVEELSTSEGGSGDERGMSTTGGSGDELGSGSSTGAPVGIGSLVHDQPESKQPESKQPESKQPVGIGSSECAQPPGSKESCPTRTMNTVFAPHEGAAASSTFLAGSRAGSTPTPTIPAITPDYYYSCE